MEMKKKNIRIFPWQADALASLIKKNGTNNCHEMRNAFSVYVLAKYSIKMTKKEEDLLHFKARTIFERRKR